MNTTHFDVIGKKSKIKKEKGSNRIYNNDASCTTNIHTQQQNVTFNLHVLTIAAVVYYSLCVRSMHCIQLV